MIVRTDLSSSYTVLGPIAEYVSSEEGDFEALSPMDEDEGWVYIDARQQIGKSGLSVPIMKEDPRYESDRRKKMVVMGIQSGFTKASKKGTEFFGYGSEEKRKEGDGMKRFPNNRKQAPPRRRMSEGAEVFGGARLSRSDREEHGFAKGEHRKPAHDAQSSGAVFQGPRRRSEGVESSGGAGKVSEDEHRKPAHKEQNPGAALQARVRRTPFSMEEEIVSAMSSTMGSTESVRSANFRHSTTSAPRKQPAQNVQSKPRHARAGSVNDEEPAGKPSRHPDTPRPRHMTSSGVSDKTVSWRRGRTSEASIEQPPLAPFQTDETRQDLPRTKRHPALELTPQAPTLARKEQANKKKPAPRTTHISHEPSFPAGDGPRYCQAVTYQPLGLQNISYRERSRSLDSTKWSSHDSDSDDEPRSFVAKVNQIAPKDDNEWRIPPIGSKKKELEKSTTSQAKTGKRNLQPTVENGKDDGSVYDPSTFKDNALFDAVFKNMTEHEKEQYGVSTPQEELSHSERYSTFSKKEIAEARKGKKKVEDKKESDEDDGFFDAEG